MPRLWTETIEAHRREVRDAALDATAVLVARHGARVTMSQVAAETGIARATLYKYFPDAEALLFAWHERQVARHLEQLAEIRDRADGPAERLEAVLEAYALIVHEHHGTELGALLHRGPHVARAEQELERFVRALLADAAKAGAVRGDVPARELAGYCVQALRAAAGLDTTDAVRRLVTVVLAGLRPGRVL